MEYENGTRLPKRKEIGNFGELIRNKKVIWGLYILAVLWMAVGAQFVVRRVFARETGITQAFVNTDTGLVESTLEMTAAYGKDTLTEADKKELISYLANGLGIKSEEKVDVTSNESRIEMTFVRKAKKADTTIKVISLLDNPVTDAFAQVEESREATHYIVVRLTIFEDMNSDILAYQKKLKDLLAELDIKQKNVNTTLQFSGSYAGNLSLEEKNQVADEMIGNLEGEIVFESRENDLYTIYAYTGSIPEYITVDHNKINIQVAMSYDQSTDTTKVYLATPIISGDW